MSYQVKKYRNTDYDLKDKLLFNSNDKIVWTDSFNPDNLMFDNNSMINIHINKIVIGRDERKILKRTDKFPLSAITNLSIHFPSGKRYLGTGTIISKHYILTVAHNLFKESEGGWAKNIRLFPGKSGRNQPFGYRDMNNMYIPEGWTINQSLNFDFGLIEIKKPFKENTGCVGLLSHRNGFQNIKASIIGYPINKRSGKYLFYDNGIIKDTKKLEYEIDTSGGQSGSGLFYHNKEGIFLVGIHSRGMNMKNFGVSLNRNNLNFLNKIINKNC